MICSGDTLEELIQRVSLDSFPSEQRVSSWQHRVKSKKAFTQFVWTVTHLVLEELSSLYQIGTTESLLLREVHFDLSTAPSALRVLNHVLLQLVDCMLIRSSANVQH